MTLVFVAAMWLFLKLQPFEGAARRYAYTAPKRLMMFGVRSISAALSV